MSLAYRQRLDLAVQHFVTWLEGQGLSLEDLLPDADAVNRVLVAYVQNVYDKGGAEWLGRYAILGIQDLNRDLRSKLRKAWDSMFAWHRLEGTKSRLPFRREVVQALCYFSILAALELDPGASVEWLLFGVILRTGFAALLRPQEIAGLATSHIKLPSGPEGRIFRSLTFGVIAIEEPKNKAVAARQQVRLVRDPSAVEWLRWACSFLPPGSRLWPFSRERLARCLKTSLRFFDLQDVGYTLGSLRAGGATHLLEAGYPVDMIKFAGGWAAERTLAHYLQEAESAATLLSLSPAAVLRLETALSSLGFLERPPGISPLELLNTWTLRKRRLCSLPLVSATCSPPAATCSYRTSPAQKLTPSEKTNPQARRSAQPSATSRPTKP